MPVLGEDEHVLRSHGKTAERKCKDLNKRKPNLLARKCLALTGTS